MWYRQGSLKYIYITSKTKSSTHLLVLYQQQCSKCHDSKIAYTEIERSEGEQKPRYTKDFRSYVM